MPDTIKYLLSECLSRLEKHSDSAQRDCEILLCHTLEQPRSQLYAWPEKQVSEKQQTTFKQLLLRRINGEPIAHITGKQDFWSLSLCVTSDTLIPRADTERLVELALEHIPMHAPRSIADLGTGSGAIALAIASERPSVQIVATDKSRQALLIAEQNARQLEINNVQFVFSSWFDNLQNQRFDLIISNPPYIAERDPHLEQGDVRFDPDSALTAGPGGMDDLSLIIEQSPGFLKQGGWLILEHGYDQQHEVIQLLKQRGFINCNGFRDYANNPRVVVAQWLQS